MVTITGTEEADILVVALTEDGQVQDGTVLGLGGDDEITGGAGNDTLAGGLGDDLYTVSELDTLIENFNEGIDTVLSSVRWVLGANFENLELTGTAAINGFGNAAANSMAGNSARNYLDGAAGLDTLYGREGDDYYRLGDATLVNGSFLWDEVIENRNRGIDTVEVSADVGRFTYQLELNVENMIATGVSGFQLWGNALKNSLTGNDAANIIEGFEGNDTLDGKLGFDTLKGGLGNDIFIVSDADTLIENPGEGVDTVQSSVRWVLGDNFEKLELTGTAEINGFGNAAANTLTGNSARNYLDGGLGRDVLRGGDGNDYYRLGDTTLSNFSLIWDSVNEDINGGSDTVEVSSDVGRSTYQLGANVESGVITGASKFNLTGNDLSNDMTGNNGANILSGLGGADSLRGGEGRDTLKGGLGDDEYYLLDTTAFGILGKLRYDTVIEEADGGIDSVLVSSDAPSSSIIKGYTLATNIENGQISAFGTSPFFLTGNVLDNILQGNEDVNTLSGMDGDDALYGLDGEDRLVGGAGNDTLYGGEGDDIFIFDTALDEASNVDVLMDFDSASGDALYLDDAVFTGITEALLTFSRSDLFHVGTEATLASHRIIFNPATGALIFDSNGNAAGGATQFAILGPGLEFSSTDFFAV